MTRHNARIISALMPLLALALCLCPTDARLAEKSLSQYTYSQLSAIHRQIDEGEVDIALKALGKLLEETEKRPYEKAVVLQTLGYAHASRASYREAILAFQASLALQQLPEATRQQLRYGLGQLYLREGRASEAVRILKLWFEQSSRPSADAYLLLGQAYAQDKRYREAIPRFKRAIELAETPQVNWYEALLAMYYETKSYRDCVPLLSDMIHLFPDRHNYWQQLAAVHLTLNDNDTALAVLELALRKGVLKEEKQLLQLARLYLHAGIPYKAARLLQEQMKVGKIGDDEQHRELLLQAWRAARERRQAILALENTVTREAKPQHRLLLAQWYIEDGRWRAAEQMLQFLVRNTSEDKQRAHAWLLLGVTRYELGKTAQAQEAFNHAVELPDTRDTAMHWLQYIDVLAANS